MNVNSRSLDDILLRFGVISLMRIFANGSRGKHAHNIVAWCVLQCVAVCCSVLQCVAVHIGLEANVHTILSCGACCSMLQCVAVCCSVLQCK